MDATDQIANEYNRLLAMDRDDISGWPFAKQVVYYVVSVRCEIDINGFESVYDQLLTAAELGVFIDGLNRIGESEAASAFLSGYELLKRDGFYNHMNWNRVSPNAIAQIIAIGHHIGDRLWKLDDKLAILLDKS